MATVNYFQNPNGSFPNTTSLYNSNLKKNRDFEDDGFHQGKKPRQKQKSGIQKYFSSLLGYEPKIAWGRLWRALIAEFVATAFFVFFATGGVVIARSFDPATGPAGLVLICLAQGMGLATAIFFAANVSGGHLNPAVTLAVVVTARFSIWQGLLYWIAQIGGALIGSLLLQAVIPGNFEGQLGSTTLGPGTSDGEGFLLEIIMTFALVIVVFSTALDDVGFGKIAPLAIGLVVLIDLIIGYRLTGSSMNPARSLGPAIVSNTWDSFWLYIFGPLLGGVIAGVLWDVVFATRPPNIQALTRGTRMETAGRVQPSLPPAREGQIVDSTFRGGPLSASASSLPASYQA